MKIYKVGGAVRDELLGLEPTDNDWVVVGSTPKEMLSMGYKQVGKDFPVFLHPDTKEEYALARKEKSTGPGHQAFKFSFDPNVTIEEDLLRRDITINAIAKDMTDGSFIDPYNGRDDIKNKVLRHVSSSFKEDPLRIFRVGRFYTKFNKEFEIDSGLEEIIIQMFPDIIHLSGERIWAETEKALNYEKPYIYFYCLLDLAKNNKFFVENYLKKYLSIDPVVLNWRYAYDYQVQTHVHDANRFSTVKPHGKWYEINPGVNSPEAWWSIMSSLVSDIDSLNARLNVPKKYRKMSQLTNTFRNKYFKEFKNLSTEEKVNTLFECMEMIQPSKNIDYAVNVGFIAANDILGSNDIHKLKDFIIEYSAITPSEDEKKLSSIEIIDILNKRKLKLIEQEINKAKG